MRSLEILTAQNVSIDYNLASVTERGIAYLLDVLFMGVLILILILIVNVFIPSAYLESAGKYKYYFIVVPVIVFYTLVSEILGNGMSLGKKIMGLKVVKVNGTEARMSDYLIRWAFRSIDIYLSFFTLGVIMVNSTLKSQRLGDMLANTAVIKIKPERKVSLSVIENIKSKTTHEIRYREVLQMNEREMLIVKTSLDQFRQNPNDAHIEAIEMLSDIVQERLRIKRREATSREFLQALINDYIVMTR